jgi:putative ABC transport system ATP-binding protein
LNLIETKNICKYYGKDVITKAIDDVSINIGVGDMTAIMGPSGSGKSTLLHILGLLDSFTKGKYILDNLDVLKLTKYEIAKIRNEKIGFVFQQFALIRGYSAMENVELPLLQSNIFKSTFNKVRNKEIKERALRSLEIVGLEEHKKKYPSQLSGVQQQRVAIARSLINKPSLIIADEPTGALDQNTGIEIMSILNEINKNGTTIIIVTHDQKVANKCNKVINMIDGRIS